MSYNKYFSLTLFIILFITTISKSYQQEDNNDKTTNKTKSLYDYEDDEEEEDRKKGKNETHLLIFNDSNYSTEIKKYESLFLIFYESPCKTCKMYMPHYIRLSHYSYDLNMGIKFAKVDGTTNKKIVEEYNIESFPTVLLFYQNKTYLYKTEITMAGLLKFYKRIKNGPIREIKNMKNLEIVLKAHLWILLSTIKDKTLTLYKSLIQYASSNDKIEFVSCLSDDCIEKYGSNDIIFFHEGEDKINYYSKDYEPIDKATLDSVKTFMSIFNVEYGTLLNHQFKLDMLFENDNKKAIFYFRNSDNKKYTSKDILFKELGKELRLKNIYTYVLDVKGDNIYDLMTNFFVVSENELPTIIYYDLINKNQNSYTYRLMNVKEKNINKKYILDFIDKVKKGKIKRDLHTDFPPKFKEKDGIRNVVGRSYDKDVIEEKKNVCILFIDAKNESEKTKNYIEIMVNISEKYNEDEQMNIVFEMIDGRINEPRDITIESIEEFPLIFLYTNDMKEKKIIKFKPKDNDSITESEIETFLIENLEYKVNEDDNKENDL